LDLEEKLDGAQTALSVGAAALAALLDASGALGSYGEILSPEAQLAEIRREIDVLKNLESDQLQESTEEIEKLDENLKRLDRLAEQFEGLDPAILVSPFRDQVESVVPMPLSNSDYYAPSVIVLLLQHLCVTFGALAIVREQKMGTIELFQVSPLSSIEILLGKYLSYLVVAVIVGVVLTGLLVFLLGVPLLGSIWAYAAVMLLLAFASLGMGFVLSLFAGTISQAVQYTMMLLLASVFFSGFFLNLEAMSLPVRALSRVLPASYGVQLLQDVALRGELLDPKLVVRLTALAMISFGLAWYLLRRVLRRV